MSSNSSTWLMLKERNGTVYKDSLSLLDHSCLNSTSISEMQSISDRKESRSERDLIKSSGPAFCLQDG
ncbi:hypothetical protein Y1Q_0002316 [Alligator mississippiensis]|uniref:Uncharacterized protein n=1 Tax=Alligator mississippiensis TaxID=8496 RepID=A0A151MH26_ALLMI|nr:hypothetical protein Y1Q_0002316 [Alligator mississippiensis]